jgi:integrase
MASVSKRKWTHKGVTKESWVVRYNDGQAWRMKTFERKKEADSYRQQIEADIRTGTHVAPSASLTFAKLAANFMADCDRRMRIKDRMSGNTHSWLRNWVDNHLVPYFGEMLVVDIKPPHVLEFVNLKSETYSRVAVVGLVKTMKQILQLGMDQGVVGKNVVRDNPPRIPLAASKQIEIPTLTQIQNLMEVLDRPREKRFRFVGPAMHRVMVYLGLMAGLRSGEICALQWQFVDFSRNVLRVRHSLSRTDGVKGPKSEAGNRDVPMAAELAAALQELRATQGSPTEGFVLRTRRGGPFNPNDLRQKHWHRIAEDAGLRRADGTLMGMHTLRHAAASLWIRSGLAPLAVKKIIGHGSIQVTLDIYGHLFPEDDSSRAGVSASATEIARRVPLTIDALTCEEMVSRTGVATRA